MRTRVCARAYLRVCELRRAHVTRPRPLVEHVRRVGYVPAERDEPLPLRRHAARPDHRGKPASQALIEYSRYVRG